MPWGYAIAAAGTYLAADKQSSAANKSSAAMSAAEREAIQSQERMFDKSLELQAPYREAGYNAISGLQGLLDPAQRADMLSQYYAGPEYAMMSKQVEEQQLRNMAATGNLRGGVGQNALAGIAPSLGIDYLSGRQNTLTGLANMGMGAASQGAQGAQYLGTQIAQGQRNLGDIYAQNQIAQSNIFGNTMGQLGGLAMNYYTGR